MRTNLDPNELEIFRSRIASDEDGQTVLSLADEFAYFVELIEEDELYDRVAEVRQLWRDVTSRDDVSALTIFSGIAIYLTTTWALEDFFLMEVLTPFERAVVVDEFLQILAHAESMGDDNDDDR